MEHGDLSNRVEPKIMVVFENLIGTCEDERKAEKYMKRGNWAKAREQWRLNQLTLARLSYLTMRKHMNITAVTFVPYPDMAGEFQSMLDDAGMSIEVEYHQPEILARQVAYKDDITAIYDPARERRLFFGRKGRYVENVNQIGGF